MVQRFLTLNESDSLELATREMAAGHQKDFPVTDGHQITGILLHRDVVKGAGPQAVGSPTWGKCCVIAAPRSRLTSHWTSPSTRCRRPVARLCWSKAMEKSWDCYD